MWETFVQHESVEAIMNDKGLAKIGDGIVNLCYSLADAYEAIMAYLWMTGKITIQGDLSLLFRHFTWTLRPIGRKRERSQLYHSNFF